jgi:hypothetical protein
MKYKKVFNGGLMFRDAERSDVEFVFLIIFEDETSEKIRVSVSSKEFKEKPLMVLHTMTTKIHAHWKDLVEAGKKPKDFTMHYISACPEYYDSIKADEVDYDQPVS